MLKRLLSILILCSQAVVASASSAEEQLFSAAERGDGATVKNLLETHSLDPNTTNEFLWTPLHLACRSGSLSLAKLLVEEFGADVDFEDDEGDTPLYEAIVNYNTEIVTYLLNQGASLEWNNDRDEGPLDVAVKTESNTLVSVVIGRLVPDSIPRHRKTLHYAVIADMFDILKTLLDARVVHPDDRDEFLRTPLHIAAGNGQPDSVYELIMRGARVDLMDSQRKKPVAYAVRAHKKARDSARRRFVQIIRLLINARNIQSAVKRCSDAQCECKRPKKKQRVGC